MTPGNLYGLFLRSFRAGAGSGADSADGVIGAARLNELRALFARDSHGAWPACGLKAKMPGADEAAPGEEGEDERPAS